MQHFSFYRSSKIKCRMIFEAIMTEYISYAGDVRFQQHIKNALTCCAGLCRPLCGWRCWYGQPSPEGKTTNKKERCHHQNRWGKKKSSTQLDSHFTGMNVNISKFSAIKDLLSTVKDLGLSTETKAQVDLCSPVSFFKHGVNWTESGGPVLWSHVHIMSQQLAEIQHNA